MNTEKLKELHKSKSQKFEEKLSQGVFILFVWVILFAFGLSVWLKVWFGLDLIYQPGDLACVLCVKQLIKFIYTVSLFAIAGNIAKNAYNIFGKYWQMEALGYRLESTDEGADENTREGKERQGVENQVKHFLNSSPTNITFYRPLFFPLISAVLAIPVVFLVYGFNADLPRIAVVSFLVGLVANVVLSLVRDKADNFVKGILGAN